jgi:cell division protein FtsB
MDFQSLLKSKAITVLLVLVLGAVAFVTFELYMQKRQVDIEIARLTEQSDSLSKDNGQLSELIKYLDTPEYKEREAREKLNLKKPGEEVVVLPEGANNGEVASAQAETRSNPEKWFNYFFSVQ